MTTSDFRVTDCIYDIDLSPNYDEKNLIISKIKMLQKCRFQLSSDSLAQQITSLQFHQLWQNKDLKCTAGLLTSSHRSWLCCGVCLCEMFCSVLHYSHRVKLRSDCGWWRHSVVIPFPATLYSTTCIWWLKLLVTFQITHIYFFGNQIFTKTNKRKHSDVRKILNIESDNHPGG